MLTYKIVDGIRSEKVIDILEKAVNICCTNEITKQQVKVISNDKEVNEIRKKKMLKTPKQKKQVGESDKVVKSS